MPQPIRRWEAVSRGGHVLGCYRSKRRARSVASRFEGGWVRRAS